MAARAGSAATIRNLLTQRSTLYDVAAATPGALPIAGRGTAYVIQAEPDRWLVRHYHRGGALARFLDDKYLAVRNRALHELNVTNAARTRGIPTPEVVAAVTYHAGLFSRFDIAFVFVRDARDLAAVLFDADAVDGSAVTRAAQLIRVLIARGLEHPDLNLKNVLIAPERAYVIDLDRARIHDRLPRRVAGGMQRRFIRSLEKWQRRTGRVVAETYRKELEDAFLV